MDMTKCTVVTSSRPFEQKEKMRCIGGSCNRCGETAYLSLVNPAIDKLHSTWIDDSILAMQRPNDALMKESNLIEQFQTNGIVAIFNLTEPGEHPYCGGGNMKESGFPYHPEKLMAAGIKHFNYAWPDMTAPPITLMKDIVRVACNEILQGGKIAVHCHAGYGRTGIAIAAILISLKGYPALQVMSQIREKRPGSIQTSKQRLFVYEFERCHWEAVNVFPARIVVESAADVPATETEPAAEGTLSASASFSRSMMEFTMMSSPRKSPRQAIRKLASERSLSIDTSFRKSGSTKGRSQKCISANTSAKMKDRSRASSSPRSTSVEGLPLPAIVRKTISQSLRDQQYSLPVEELVPSGPGNGGQNHAGKPGTGGVDLLWNHKCVVLCARALKAACSMTCLEVDSKDSVKPTPEALAPATAEASPAEDLMTRITQSAQNLAHICTSMTGLLHTPTGQLDTVRQQTQRTILNLLDTSDLADDISEDDFLYKRSEISHLRLEKHKSDINKGNWDRVLGTSRVLFTLSKTADPNVSLDDQIKTIINEYRTMDSVEDYGSGYVTPSPRGCNEVLSRNDSIYVLSHLLLDFLDTRLDCVFDETISKKLYQIWSGRKEANSITGTAVDADENVTVDENATTTSSATPISQDFEKKSNTDLVETIYKSINTTFVSDKLERPKLSQLQQMVDLLQGLYAVISSPARAHSADPTPDTVADGTVSPFRTDSDLLAQEDCYKLICLRLALTCTLLLRSQKTLYTTDDDDGRCPKEISQSLARLILRSFKLDSTSHFPIPLTPTQVLQSDPHSPVDSLDPPENIFDCLSINVNEDVQNILGVMNTLHLLAVKSWSHLDILPNRLRINRRLTR